MADPTPPLPTTSARLPASGKPLAFDSADESGPVELVAEQRPVVRSSTALAAPAICTVGVSSSTSRVVVTLCGMVIRAPRILVSLNRYLKNSGYSSALTPIGTTTASIPFFSNHGL